MFLGIFRWLLEINRTEPLLVVEDINTGDLLGCLRLDETGGQFHPFNHVLFIDLLWRLGRVGSRRTEVLRDIQTVSLITGVLLVSVVGLLHDVCVG